MVYTYASQFYLEPVLLGEQEVDCDGPNETEKE